VFDTVLKYLGLRPDPSLAKGERWRGPLVLIPLSAIVGLVFAKLL
jgi:hypothetical protein